ncbi:HD-GYP domain, c-di-GMP phosphodiesterase class II (or its inactivated variant) [Amphibacillus marinus]|uniref:HD-GYP domain, c-di-GMP phosphodiesterase class II (Or its inactivated variant) n=1 Tax=Amphibacillus marinus TaxID=872970 RepID=A0A1H8PE18_9BACI|nr:HD domain-containing phosphohydrolase [Amphibacillus marinus]SEO40175.1 HD-GYP domain, c-di-GMP phosphodiesterase class II (or its inactivated variant) [Amphibacillus marinus]
MIKLIVHPSQLVPNCIISADVYGKSNQPIIASQTVVQEVHIDVLKRFLIDNVEVEPILANGNPFSPKKRSKKEASQSIVAQENYIKTFKSFYLETVTCYQQMFKRWQSGEQIDIHELRQLIVPLLEQIEHNHVAIFMLAEQASEEDYFFHQSVATSLLSGMLAKYAGFNNDWIQVSLAALLADAGMAKLTDSLLSKRKHLSQIEMVNMKKHPVLSYRYVEKKSSLSNNVKLAILQHHERIDGRGYPLALTGNKINPYAKILSIAISYFILSFDRYNQGKPPVFLALSDMQQLVDKQIDQQYFAAFVDVFEKRLSGKSAYLTNGQIGIIKQINMRKEWSIEIYLDATDEMLVINENNLHDLAYLAMVED